MDIIVDIAIIGAGTAGISAFKEANKTTNSIILIDHGPLGTTCARVGCMPSKTLIQVANSFHERLNFSTQGITGTNNLSINIPKVMQHVRKLRDSFTSGTIKYLKSLGNQFIGGNAYFEEPKVIKVGRKNIIANKIIIATGAHSIVPDEWLKFSKQILTTENIFEQHQFKQNIAAIGAGANGLELGQALSRLGINISIFHSHNFLDGLSDPIVNACAIHIMREELQLNVGSSAIIKNVNKNLLVKNNKKSFTANQILATLGRKPNLLDLKLENAGVQVDQSGLPIFNRSTLKVNNLPIYIIGDVNEYRPLLHEATDAGHIAGYNISHNKPGQFHRRVPLSIIFTDPNIAMVGKSFHELQQTDFIIGECDFSNQGRSRIMFKNKGILRIYASRSDGIVLGAEMIAPGGEHIAHLLAWSIQQKMTVIDILKMPFYHPVIEEGLRTALHELAKQISNKPKTCGLAMCDSQPMTELSQK